MIEHGLLDADLRPLDRLGRVQPHRLNVLTFAKAIPGFAEQFRTVPAKFYTATDGERVQVECPCGEPVTCELGSLTLHGPCKRVYLYAGKRLLVANSPTREEVAVTT